MGEVQITGFITENLIRLQWGFVWISVEFHCPTLVTESKYHLSSRSSRDDYVDEKQDESLFLYRLFEFAGS